MSLSIRNLSKTYANGVQALKQFSLEVPKGMFGLLGPNGAGKSTLMRTIATLQEPDEGDIRFDDIDVLRQKERLRRALGYLPQEFGVYPKVSAHDMLHHIAALKGIVNPKERRDAVNRLLRLTNLVHARRKNLGGFSGGMKQRFGIAQALLGNPQLIIVDEPTAGLDPEERVRFHNLLSEIGQNVVVILSTHIVSDVSDLCQNMAIIDQGELVMAGKPLENMRALRRKIWRKLIDKADLADHRERYRVISSKLEVGRTLIHVYSETEPGEGFEPVEPDLEDVYFTAIQGLLRQEPVGSAEA